MCYMLVKEYIYMTDPKQLSMHWLPIYLLQIYISYEKKPELVYYTYYVLSFLNAAQKKYLGK